MVQVHKFEDEDEPADKQPHSPLTNRTVETMASSSLYGGITHILSNGLNKYLVTSGPTQSEGVDTSYVHYLSKSVEHLKQRLADKHK